MNEKNLGVCFAPSLFHLCGSKEDPSAPKRQKRTPMSKATKELTDNLVSTASSIVSYPPRASSVPSALPLLHKYSGKEFWRRTAS